MLPRAAPLCRLGGAGGQSPVDVAAEVNWTEGQQGRAKIHTENSLDRSRLARTSVASGTQLTDIPLPQSLRGRPLKNCVEIDV